MRARKAPSLGAIGRGYSESPPVDGSRVMVAPGGEMGAVALAEASPKGWKEISRFVLAPQSGRRALKAKVWIPPVIAHGRLCLRDQEILWCFKMRTSLPWSKSADERRP